MNSDAQKPDERNQQPPKKRAFTAYNDVPMPRRYQIDETHPIGGEMSDILRGLVMRLRLPWLIEHYSRIVVLAVFSFLNGCISIGLMSILALLTRSPFIFPSGSRMGFQSG